MNSGLGHLYTNKTWPDCLADLRDELGKWGIVDFMMPTKKEADRSGEVIVSLARNGMWVYPSCSRFPTSEQNLRAIVIAIEGVRKAE